MALGERIKQIRKLRNLSQQGLSDLTINGDKNEVSQGAIAAIENRDSNQSKFAPALAKALNIELDLLYSDTEITTETISKNTTAANEQSAQKLAQPVVEYENVKDFQSYVDKLHTREEIDQVHELLSHFVVLPKEYKQEVLAIVNRIYLLETGLKQIARQYGRKPDWRKDEQQQQPKDT